MKKNSEMVNKTEKEFIIGKRGRKIKVLFSPKALTTCRHCTLKDSKAFTPIVWAKVENKSKNLPVEPVYDDSLIIDWRPHRCIYFRDLWEKI